MTDTARILTDSEITDPATWQDEWRKLQPGGEELHRQHLDELGEAMAGAKTHEERRAVVMVRGVSMVAGELAMRRYLLRQHTRLAFGVEADIV